MNDRVAFLRPPTLDMLAEDHEVQRALCADLEAVADRLPALPPTPAIRRLCARIVRVTEAHFDRAELVLGSLPRESAPGADAIAVLHEMHALDEAHGHDLIEALWRQVAGAGERQAGQLAYMLRCFFDGCRRAIALKESWIDTARRRTITLD